MAKSSVVEINMFGRLADAEAAWKLAECASAASGTAPWDNGFYAEDFLKTLQRAEAEHGPVTIEIHDGWEQFEELMGACQEAGISYVAFVGNPGSDGWTSGLTWRPGMKQEYEFLVNGEEPVVSLAKLEQAIGGGTVDVVVLADNLSEYFTVGAVEIDDRVVEAWQALADGEFAPTP